MITYENVHYQYHDCLKMSNGVIELYVSTNMGPRILGYNKVGKNSLFNVFADPKERFEGKQFDSYYWQGAYHRTTGGHRMWITPEIDPMTYYPDNDPVTVTKTETGAIFTPPAQKVNRVQTEMEVAIGEGTDVTVTHRVTNLGDADRECALWTISMMALGGLELVKQNSHDADKLHNRTMSFWTYSDPSDYRFFLGKDYIAINHDPENTTGPFKVGIDNRTGIALYCSKDQVFITRYENDHDNGRYPDGECSFETYAACNIMELETLDQIKTVKPGETSQYSIHWSIADNPGTPAFNDEAALDAFWKQIVG